MEKKIDLRLRKTYQSLHAAFTELLEEKRFEELTVGELCDRAAIRRTTFYKHFADKYDYFAFYLQEMMSTLQHHLPQDSAPSAAFVHMCRELLDFLHLHSRMVSNIRDSSMFPLLLDILLVLAGFFLDCNVLLLVLTPLLLPTATAIGLSQIHLATIIFVAIGLGGMTPPMATQLYIAVRICNSDLLKTCKALIPLFLFAALPVLLLVTYVPFLSEWLPSLLI